MLKIVEILLGCLGSTPNNCECSQRSPDLLAGGTGEGACYPLPKDPNPALGLRPRFSPCRASLGSLPSLHPYFLGIWIKHCTGREGLQLRYTQKNSLLSPCGGGPHTPPIVVCDHSVPSATPGVKSSYAYGSLLHCGSPKALLLDPFRVLNPRFPNLPSGLECSCSTSLAPLSYAILAQCNAIGA